MKNSSWYPKILLINSVKKSPSDWLHKEYIFQYIFYQIPAPSDFPHHIPSPPWSSHRTIALSDPESSGSPFHPLPCPDLLRSQPPVYQASSYPAWIHQIPPTLLHYPSGAVPADPLTRNDPSSYCRDFWNTGGKSCAFLKSPPSPAKEIHPPDPDCRSEGPHGQTHILPHVFCRTLPSEMSFQFPILHWSLRYGPVPDTSLHASNHVFCSLITFLSLHLPSPLSQTFPVLIPYSLIFYISTNSQKIPSQAPPLWLSARKTPMTAPQDSRKRYFPERSVPEHTPLH